MLLRPKKPPFSLFLIGFIICYANATVPEKPRALPSLLVLHPVDLQSGLVPESLHLDFRKIFKSNSSWKIVSLEKMEKTFRDYNLGLNTPCNDFTCAFDAGAILQAQYTLYSSITIYQNFYIFNLNLVDISTGKVLWSENGEIPIKSGGTPSEALLHKLDQIAKALKPGNIKKSTEKSKSTIGILNVSPDSDCSRILFDRLATHANFSGQYDLIDENELSFILASLNIEPAAIVPTSDNLIPLGKKMGVDYLVYSRIKKKSDEFNLRLALFDINKKELIREWPYRSSDFRKLLRFEDKFISKIMQPQFQPTPSVQTQSASFWKWVSIPISIVSGGTLVYASWVQHRFGQEKYKEWKNSNKTWQAIQRRPGLEDDVKQARLNRNIFGIMSGIFLSSSIVLISL